MEGGILLGVPKIISSSGVHQVESVMELIEEWGIKDNIFVVCCDSTATQPGKYSGAMTLLQRELPQPIILSFCRRHIIKLHAKHAMNALFGQTTAPYEPLFKKSKDNWNKESEAAQDSVLNEHKLKL